MKLSKITSLIACAAVIVGLTSGISRVHADYTDSVGIGSASEYSVLGASTVTNTGASTLPRSLGLFPGTSVTGFPPGIVSAPGVVNVANAAAGQAQADATGAYVSAAGRALTATVPADLGGQTLTSGVYATSGKGALSLTGTLTLDAGGNTDAVFIFQTDSSLTTASGSSVSLINGAQACRVYWVVGSSATLGTGSSFVGTIMAQASITVTSGATVQGRALALTGAVTLDNNVFSPASCQPPTTPPGGTTPTTTPGIPKTGASSGFLLIIAGFLVVTGVSIVATRRRMV